MDNVIQGPWSEDNKKNFNDDMVQAIFDNLFEDMRRLGFDNQDEDYYSKDLGMIVESIRSYLLKLQEEYHEFQELADNVFIDIDNDLYISSYIEVDFEGIQIELEEDLEDSDNDN